jgi:hypothetical protein
MGAAFALLLGAVASPAGAAAQSDQVSFSTNPFNSCNSEFVGASGTAHRVQITKSDGSFIQRLNFHVTVVGSQGNEYVLNWQEDFQSNSEGLSFTSRQLVVSKGAQPNQLQQFNFRITFNPFSFELISVTDCRGTA